MELPIGVSDYYDFLPGTSHAAGDVWVDLPSFGIVPPPFLPGLVITPACDLANRKVESVTFLPIIPLRRYLTSNSMIAELKLSTAGQLSAAGAGQLIEFPDKLERVSLLDIEAAQSLLSSHGRGQLSVKQREALGRAHSGLQSLADICSGVSTEATFEAVKKTIGGKGFPDIIRRIVTNSYRLDLHFLPRDGQRREWSGIHENSVVLFRYPISLPFELLELAQERGVEQWERTVESVKNVYPCAPSMHVRPMKRLSLRPRFSSDLLTRFTNMFGRLGSPDFTADAVERIVSEVLPT
ncbi:MAG TPA: hypothetical protein VGM67_18535 [Gemmatimonadaceae bacterium]|jgi:hypothetical protein